MKIAGIIPARYKSSRYPGKPLIPLLGKPMVIHVADIVATAIGKENTFIASDSDLIAETVKKWGYQVLMTSERALTGTDRVWEASKKIEADIYVNIQGDEPLLNPADINLVIDAKKKHMDYVVNGFHPISEIEDPKSINIPKVVFDEHNRLIYMSRAQIPGYKSEKSKPAKYYKQVCIYAFSKHQLDKYGNFGRKSHLEEYEDIEILRLLDLDIPVYMIETAGVSFAVDVPEDVEIVENLMRRKYNNGIQ